ncbi:DNA excision repair protein ERCC-1-like [Accipiter gentilis]|uniref:DNA excision repair protein ERCC-1-like n=1 Tax=Astur gentilis TaxID=8957 RepID=UPI00210F688E|nr:DNA excision repair protein ERCC-1-like [Accipiter gentilis]
MRLKSLCPLHPSVPSLSSPLCPLHPLTLPVPLSPPFLSPHSPLSLCPRLFTLLFTSIPSDPCPLALWAPLPPSSHSPVPSIPSHPCPLPLLVTSRPRPLLFLSPLSLQKDPHQALKELAKICILADCTLLVAWSPKEAGRYLETYKAYEQKPPDLLKERVEQDFLSWMTDCLTSIKLVNKMDALSLLTTFGLLAAVVDVSREDLSLCPGVGPQKV